MNISSPRESLLTFIIASLMNQKSRATTVIKQYKWFLSLCQDFKKIYISEETWLSFSHLSNCLELWEEHRFFLIIVSCCLLWCFIGLDLNKFHRVEQRKESIDFQIYFHMWKFANKNYKAKISWQDRVILRIQLHDVKHFSIYSFKLFLWLNWIE